MNYASSANLLRKEEIIIAPYGTHSKDTRGRLYPEEEQKRRGIRYAGVNPPAAGGGLGI